MSKMKLLKILAFALVVGGALFFALRNKASHPLRVGESAPDFSLPTLSPGSITLRDYRQRVVVVNFWVTWCPPCVQELPSLEKFAAQMRAQGVAVMGVSVDEDLAALQKFVSKAHLSFPIARDPDRSVASRYGTFKFPETYIIDRDGRIAEKIVGPINWQDPRIIALVQELARGLPHPGQ